MPNKPAAELTRRISGLNARLDKIERLLDTVEDLLEELWDAAVAMPSDESLQGDHRKAAETATAAK
jgi:hypothetical protein